MRVLVDVPTFLSGLPKIPAGTEGVITAVYPGDDFALRCDLVLGSSHRTTVTFFENEVGQLIEVLP